jgi:cell division protein FtsI (penicillin-binding protein 3)
MNEIKNLNKKDAQQENSYAAYYKKASQKQTVVPNLKGMSGMDAVACWVICASR